jgi:hypothetical protein
MNRYKTNSKSNSILILENKSNTTQSVYINMNYPIKLNQLKLDYYDYHGKECSYTFDNEQDMNKFVKKLNKYCSNCSHNKIKYIIGLLVVVIGLGYYFEKGDTKNNQTNILNTPEDITSTLMEQHGELKRQQSLFQIKPLFQNNQVTPSNPIPELEEGVLTNMVNKSTQETQTQNNVENSNNTSESELLNKLHNIKQQAQ